MWGRAFFFAGGVHAVFFAGLYGVGGKASNHLTVHNVPYSLFFIDSNAQSALSNDVEENNQPSTFQKSPDIKDLTKLSDKKVQLLPSVHSVSRPSSDETIPHDFTQDKPGERGSYTSEALEDNSFFAADPANALPSYPEKEQHYVPKGMFRLFLTSLGCVSHVMCLTQFLPESVKKACETTFLTWRFHGRIPPFVDVPVHFKKA